MMEVRSDLEKRYSQRFLEELGEWFWLGGSDRTEESEWKWDSDGELIDMARFWKPYEPRNEGGAEDCLVTDSHGFLSLQCELLLSYVCNID